MKYANIAIVSQNRNIDMLFTYKVPDSFESDMSVGALVVVPFGMGDNTVTGCVVEGFENLDMVGNPKISVMKEIEHVISEISVTWRQIELAKYLRDEYMLTWSEAVSLVFPSAINVEARDTIIMSGESEASKIDNLKPKTLKMLEFIEKHNKVEMAQLKKEFGSGTKIRVEELQAAGLVERTKRTHITPIVKHDTVVEVCAPMENVIAEMRKTSDVHRVKKEALRYMIENATATVSELRDSTRITTKGIEAFVKKGILKTYEEEYLRLPELFDDGASYEERVLNDEQLAAFERVRMAVDGCMPEIFALRGVTGSGKTEVYIELAKEVVKAGRTCLVLVPEISLTPQIVSKFNKTGLFNTAIFHSKLTSGEKLDQWRMVSDGRANLIIGARSATFSPFRDLGLIIVDEEHDSSYRSDSSPRYDAKNAAMFLSRIFGCPLVLASATLGTDTYEMIQSGRAVRLDILKRYNDAKLPNVDIIDMRHELMAGNRTIFSELLRERISDRLSRGEQTILYMNRKGHSTFVSCRECGFVIKCPHCDISLTYYKKENLVRCGMCGYDTRVHEKCPSCGSKYFKYFGSGTEKIEELVKSEYPGARVARLDSTITSRKGAMEDVIRKMKSGDIDILVGTQLVSKGLDFENVTLVGIVTADTTLNLPDFTAGEKTYQLLTQVSGRAGRGLKEGEVVIQTYSPTDPAIVHSKDLMYDEFMLGELDLRYAMKYPPYQKLIIINFFSHDEMLSKNSAQKFISAFRKSSAFSHDIDVHGPCMGANARIRGKFRYQVIIKYRKNMDDTDLKKFIRDITIVSRNKNFDSKVMITSDIDAKTLL